MEVTLKMRVLPLTSLATTSRSWPVGAVGGGDEHEPLGAEVADVGVEPPSARMSRGWLSRAVVVGDEHRALAVG